VMKKLDNLNKREGLGEKPAARVNIDALRDHMQSSKTTISSVLHNKTIRVPINPSSSIGDDVAARETTTSFGELPKKVTMNPNSSLGDTGVFTNPNMGEKAIDPTTNPSVGDNVGEDSIRGITNSFSKVIDEINRSTAN
nr:hypothetical protein [Tanacetum cinerariifolium]